MKTGSGGRTWIELERPKPSPVADSFAYWADGPPPETSERCKYWVRQINHGWRPNKRISRHGYSTASEWFGVYIWEYINVLAPLITKKERAL